MQKSVDDSRKTEKRQNRRMIKLRRIEAKVQENTSSRRRIKFRRTEAEF